MDLNTVFLRFCLLEIIVRLFEAYNCISWEAFLNNFITAQGIKMKFFKFNLTPIGIILHILTILINHHGNLLL